MKSLTLPCTNPGTTVLVIGLGCEHDIIPELLQQKIERLVSDAVHCGIDTFIFVDWSPLEECFARVLRQNKYFRESVRCILVTDRDRFQNELPVWSEYPFSIIVHTGIEDNGHLFRELLERVGHVFYYFLRPSPLVVAAIEWMESGKIVTNLNDL